MERRKMLLPAGWYPHTPAAAEKQLKSWDYGNETVYSNAKAGIAPHAGWDFSGSMAWNIIRSIPLDCELIIIAGGHLSSDSACRIMDYESLQTPFGELTVHRQMSELLCRDFISDRDADNTVEIMLPMIKYALPGISVVAVRLPSSLTAEEWGRNSGTACIQKGIKTFFLGSTDLSHYGARFGYLDYGSGEKARAAVKKNDAEYLRHLAEFGAVQSLEFAKNYNTACSSGAAAATAGFAQESGCTESTICEHRYSYDIYDSGSDFVGYGSILYR